MSRLAGAALLLAAAVSVCLAAGAPSALASEPVYFPADPQADFTIETAIADARESGKIAVIVFGADWCHDSRFLAQAIKSPEWQARWGSRFAVTFVDVGSPQTGRGRNLDLAADFGMPTIAATPVMFAVNGAGKALNSPKDALGWRTAEKRGKARVMAWFAKMENRRK